jgi:two-component system response regulator MprA
MDVTSRTRGAAATAALYNPISRHHLGFTATDESAPRVAPAGSTQNDAPKSASEDGDRVLIVDDDPSILRMLRIVFMGDGYEVSTATNGLEALDAVQKNDPGVIVLDLEMPLMDGREFFRELRTRGHRMPVLILSAYGAERARGELKAEAFVSKPFEPDYHVQEVQKLLETT